MAAILVLHTYRFHTAQDHFAFGYETGRIARALALGQGFSNPFHGITGPTAWEAPLYPCLVGGIFKIAGIYSPLSAILILTINSLFSALTAIPVFRIADRIFGKKVAIWATWGWALLPFCMYWATKWVWETSLSAFLLTTAVWMALELADPSATRSGWRWAGFGCLWGGIALTNPSCLTFLPVTGGWVGYRRWRARQPWAGPAALSGFLFLLCVLPWEARNALVFHEVGPIRSNAGAELRLGNGPEAEGIWMYWLHPTQDAGQLQRYVRAGEIDYARMRGREAVDFMRLEPGRTARLWLIKAWYFWAGVPAATQPPWLAHLKNTLFLASSFLAWWGGILAVRRGKHAACLLLALLLLYPATYYVTFPHGRYRHPIEPVMLILIMFLVSGVHGRRQKQGS